MPIQHGQQKLLCAHLSEHASVLSPRDIISTIYTTRRWATASSMERVGRILRKCMQCKNATAHVEYVNLAPQNPRGIMCVGGGLWGV